MGKPRVVCCLFKQALLVSDGMVVVSSGLTVAVLLCYCVSIVVFRLAVTVLGGFSVYEPSKVTTVSLWSVSYTHL